MCSAPASPPAPARSPPWKRDADFLFAQVRFSIDELLEWRAQIEFDGPVYAGIMVVPSVAMARKIGADIQQLAVPDAWIAAIEHDPNAGVDLACELVEAVRESGAFDGVHLIPVSKYREVAARLDPDVRAVSERLAKKVAMKLPGRGAGAPAR